MDARRASGTIIGVDPDIGKNGVATIRRESRSLSLQSLNFPETVEYIKSEFEAAKTAAIPFALYIEAGWLNKGNWHVTESRNGKGKATKIEMSRSSFRIITSGFARLTIGLRALIRRQK